MKTNGTIFRQSLTGGGTNDYGEPIEAAPTWDEGTPCLIQTNNDTRKGRYEDGQFRQCSFTILVEDRHKKEYTHVRLMRNRDENLGEFDVVSVEFFPSVGRVKIVV